MSAANPGGAERSKRGAEEPGAVERGRRARGRGPTKARRGGRGRAARRDERLPGLREALGVTRVARVTGLDRTGVEVACAVRPGGHVLQVTNGKGETFEEAARGAVSEAAELWASERVDGSRLVFGSAAEMRERFGAEAVIAPPDAGSAGPVTAPRLWSEAVRIAWRPAEGLADGRDLLVPAHAVHCPRADAPLLGPAVVSWSSNGMGAHPSTLAALSHALLEAAERDQLARALPHGFTADEVERRLIDPRSLGAAAPRSARWVERIEARGFRLFLFDLGVAAGGRGAPDAPGGRRRAGSRLGLRMRFGSDAAPAGADGERPSLRGDGDLGLPVAGALLVDLDEGPVPLTAGYACRFSRDEALLAAVLEAAQSRLTDIHGAREDIVAGAPEDVETLRAACVGCEPRRAARAMPSGRAPRDERSAVADLLRRLRRAGHGRAAAVDLAPDGFPLRVVKVVVPGLALSELL